MQPVKSTLTSKILLHTYQTHPEKKWSWITKKQKKKNFLRMVMLEDMIALNSWIVCDAKMKKKNNSNSQKKNWMKRKKFGEGRKTEKHESLNQLQKCLSILSLNLCCEGHNRWYELIMNLISKFVDEALANWNRVKK